MAFKLIYCVVDQDPTDQSFSYENRAFPEYDFLETPSFQQLIQQHSKSTAPACDPAEPSCRHINSNKCANFVKLCAMSAKHTKQGEVENEGPCASKILEMFGCKSKKSKPHKFNPVASAALNSAKIEKLHDHEKLNDSLHADQFGDSTLNSVLSIENEINKFMETLKTGQLDSTSDKTIKYQENKENSNGLQQDDKSNTSKPLFHDGTLKTKEKNVFSNKTNYTSNTDIDTEKLTNALVSSSSTDKNDGMLTEGKEILLTDTFALRNMFKNNMGKIFKSQLESSVNRHETKELIEFKEPEVKPY